MESPGKTCRRHSSHKRMRQGWKAGTARLVVGLVDPPRSRPDGVPDSIQRGRFSRLVR
jgi:hypothetical protein